MGRKRYTDEEKAEFKARDQAIAEAADAALAAPDAGERATAIALRSAKLATYSLRNQMMLAQQAEAAGLELHDIDTARGWKERGRNIRKGTTAVLRIVYPIQRRSSEKTEADSDKEQSTLFRTKAVFEVNQTEERRDFIPDPDAETSETDADPAAIWHDRLGQEAAKLGLAVRYVEPGSAGVAAEIDAEAGTITVAAADPLAPAALSVLAQCLAEAQTAAKASERGNGRPSAMPDEGTVLEFD